MNVYISLSGSAGLGAENAGGTEANNTYKWYQSGTLYDTTVGNGYLPVPSGLYRVEVTNSLVPGLTLVSEDESVVAMPVTLVRFDGQSTVIGNELTWTTTSETNNKGFQIERSADAKNFQTTGYVDGSGDTKEMRVYRFTDRTPFPTTYYRLKQIDYDGQFEYSKVIAVGGDGAIVKVFPNPAQNYLTVSGITQKQPLSIVDQNGRVVVEGMVSNMQQINIMHLGIGRYVVKVGVETSTLLIVAN
jgi:hypothetical protein